MIGLSTNFQVIGYSLAGIACLSLALLLSVNLKGGLRGGQLVAAAILSAAWAFILAWAAQSRNLSSAQLFFVEIIHDTAWLVFLSTLLSGAIDSGRLWIVRYGGIMLAGTILALGLGLEIYSWYNVRVQGAESILVLGSLFTALYVLIAIEQIYRNARQSQRQGLKYLCVGIGGIFAYDLFLYSNAALVGQISDLFWGARGFVVAMCVPLIVAASKRSPSWSGGIFASRQVVFHTATLFGAGIYLTIVGFSGYYIRFFGGHWGSAAQVVFFSAAVIVLFVFLFSDRSRSRLRVFISKHFFENKYDYRDEWLRLIETLTSDVESLPLKKRSIKALAQIVDSPTGMLWLRAKETETFECVAAWNVGNSDAVLPSDGSLTKFMKKTGWVIDIREYVNDSSRYVGLELNIDELSVANPDLIVPLMHDSDLLGFVVLTRSSPPVTLNYEDRDLLKTVGQQIASYLAQEAAAEQLADARQFEAFNRLTAYLMHDLKNVIAQQSLVVDNAKKHKGNPDFVDDAISTVKSSVVRMRRVIEHLHQGSAEQREERIELGSLVMQAVSQCADRKPVPRTSLQDGRLWVRGDKERLVMALYHGIRNAQDATPENGSVKVNVDVDDSSCFVRITDTGAGMDEAFIRDRLFRPFDSTKGTQGMGMGAYQLRETLQSMGGAVRIDSQPDRGTTVVLELRRSE